MTVDLRHTPLALEVRVGQGYGGCMDVPVEVRVQKPHHRLVSGPPRLLPHHVTPQGQDLQDDIRGSRGTLGLPRTHVHTCTHTGKRENPFLTVKTSAPLSTET